MLSLSDSATPTDTTEDRIARFIFYMSRNDSEISNFIVEFISNIKGSISRF